MVKKKKMVKKSLNFDNSPEEIGFTYDYTKYESVERKVINKLGKYLSPVAKEVRNFGKSLGGGFYGTIAVGMRIPTSIRKYYNRQFKRAKSLDKKTNLARILGFGIGVSSPLWAPEVVELLPKATENFIEGLPYLKAFGITNALSFANEIIRIPYSKLEHRSLMKSLEK